MEWVGMALGRAGVGGWCEIGCYAVQLDEAI